MSTARQPDRIIGHIDNLGYLRCIVCKPDAPGEHPWFADDGELVIERCDTCGRRLGPDTVLTS